MNIRELASRTGAAERQIRFMIAEGFIPSPRGGRAHADYGDDHVAAIRRYLRLRERGFPPAAVKLLLDNGQGAPFEVAPGLTLLLDPQLLGSGCDADALIEKTSLLLKDLLKEPADDPARDD